MAISVEELGKQLDALQVRMLAAEEETKMIKENAETAGTTAAGTAEIAERLGVQGVDGVSGVVVFLTVVVSPTVIDHLRKFRTIREKSSAGFGECSFSLAVKVWSIQSQS